jgi:hypothetical protein
MIIFKTETFENDQKMRVSQRTVHSNPKDEKLPEWYSEFTGHFTTEIPTPMGMQPENVSMKIEAKTLEEAFSKFIPAAKEAMRELQQEIQRQMMEAQKQIAMPTPAQAAAVKKGLIIP